MLLLFQFYYQSYYKGDIFRKNYEEQVILIDIDKYWLTLNSVNVDKDWWILIDIDQYSLTISGLI